jgi:signal transduction histidine kinase
MPTRAEALEQTSLRSAALLPITLGHDVIGVLELFSTEHHPTGEQLTILMQDVSVQIARILEWERSTAQMADLVWREQQGLLHTLHDSLGQTLTGLGMLSSGLRQQLAGTNQAAAETAQQIAQQAQLALEQVRQLARGFPVDVEPKDLIHALRELASTTESLHKIPVRVDGNGRQSVRDNRVATQLYRIAQEAVTNAVKHARPTSIGIAVAIASGLATVRIIDNGIGIQDTDGRDAGLGIRIMRYRATSIGAHLSIEPGPDSGTIVTCTMREKPTSAVRLTGKRHSKPSASRTLQ